MDKQELEDKSRKANPSGSDRIEINNKMTRKSLRNFLMFQLAIAALTITITIFLINSKFDTSKQMFH